ncbi:magnesium-transporting ATPase (P-type) [Rhizobium sp. BK529]|uniref:P-type ATPase n=1 Tax=unclassified Rhizobium TaxID=2613769 RepID=UPI0017B9C306|nr:MULTISPECIES: hypothetical protein [unclassified Rhizobium]MBB3593492.1 magnesium-transporting ATPase (P-type) [Rhizobium sp. BK529]
MTGESAPVHKSANGNGASQVFAASMIVRGRGRGLVTATGSATELGTPKEPKVTSSAVRPENPASRSSTL